MAVDPSFFTLIGQFGFPMVVAVYLLVRQESTLKGLGDIINKNTLVLSKLADKEGVKVE